MINDPSAYDFVPPVLSSAGTDAACNAPKNAALA